MSEILALEWEHDQICGVLAHVTPGKVRVQRCFALQRPVVSAAGSGSLPIDWLRGQLAKQGIHGGPTVVALPRDEAVVRRVDLPETSDDDLPTLVRFQAVAKSSVSLDELYLDFIPLPRRNEVPGREVLIATVPQPTITEVRTLCEHASLDVQSVGLTPAAVAELVARAESFAPSDLLGASLVVSRHGSRLEISVFRRSHLLFSHSARLSIDAAGPEPQAIVPEVSRALVALRGAIPDVKIERVWTLLDPPEHEPLADVLRKRLGCGVEPLDAFSAVEFDRGLSATGLNRSLYSGPIGLLLARAEPRVPAIDFLSPRKPPVKRDVRKQRRALIAGAAGVLVALLVGVWWLRLSSLDTTIAALSESQNEIKARLEKGRPISKSAKLVEEWERDSVVWLDQFSELARHMPATDRMYLRTVRFEPKNKGIPAKITVGGFARERADVMGLNEKLLAGNERYRVRPHAAKSTSDDNFYPWKFDAEILVTDPAQRDKSSTEQKTEGDSSSDGSGDKEPTPEAASKEPATGERGATPATATAAPANGAARQLPSGSAAATGTPAQVKESPPANAKGDPPGG